MSEIGQSEYDSGIEMLGGKKKLYGNKTKIMIMIYEL